MTSLASLILPVLQTMPDILAKKSLIETFDSSHHDFNIIEEGFRTLTSREQDREYLRRFFASWSQTNNSAMTVSGISNRLTLTLHRGEFAGDKLELLQTLTCLHRITDEDLAVTHRILHAQLFHEMATGIVGDDAWLQTHYIDKSAVEFKKWKDHMSLRESDLALALITTLVHEIYTHGEVEFILPLFTHWLRDTYGFGERELDRAVRWIKVHCGGTEKRHFFHAVDAMNHFEKAFSIDWSRYDHAAIVRSYMQRKAAVLKAVVLDSNA
ncbi:hypothetical protein [Niveispirillum sp. BGYR6]|uniref:hypothetical protein n=1 Tax=Niveispirillum sp. BGYR6 TaxID=2971249 RepID=UPI0022B9C499|nr:hypothetical protein [Niveispirillum sp. BGYR6]MDG5496121.1 hypothetical protein [Niveispirillum sp. BGYR6]